jgi:hypothetical protein
MTALQTVLVRKSAASTRKAATELARQHADRIYTSRETENYWRFRQRPPACFVPGSFRTKCIRDGKVCLVFGRLAKGAKGKACR